MSKITLTNLVNLQNETTAVNAINSNNVAIEAAMDNTLSRDGTTPNQMGSNLDMNSFKILNLPPPTTNYEPLRVIDGATLNGGGTITVSSLPVGGTTGQALTKNSASNFDAGWRTITGNLPTGGASGQTLTKNSSSDFDISWKYNNVTIVTPEQFGYTSYGSGDAGVAINAAINSVAGAVVVLLGPHIYSVVTPILITKDSVWIKGSGNQSNISFSPTGNNQTCITYNATPTVGVYYGRITDFTITSPDSSFVKTAINLFDVGDMVVSGVIVGYGGVYWRDNSNSSVCLKTNGRQTTIFNNVKLFGDMPIVIKTNPNAFTLCADHFHFSDIYLIAVSANPCITVDPSVVLSNTTFDGFQAWVGGTYGLYFNGTTSLARSNNVSISNVRCEGGLSATAHAFYFNPASLMANLTINNVEIDVRKLFYGRNVVATLSNIYYPINSTAIDVDTTCPSIRVDNCIFEAATTQSLGGLTTKYSYSRPGVAIPTNALYSL